MSGRVANLVMAAAWDGPEGEDWARDWRRYDRSVRPYHSILLDAAQIGVSDHVVDIGCGTGELTRAAGRAAASGSAFGVDLSSGMVDRARQLTVEDRLPNVQFAQADAQVYAFPASRFDLAVSRFGAMFFADPVAAFTNIGTALKPDRRLVLLAWRGLSANEWLRCVFADLAAGRDLPRPVDGAAGPLGLADPAVTRATLEAAGFSAVHLTPVDLPFWAGESAADAFDWFRGIGVVRGLTEGLDPARRSQALETLQATLVAHQGRGGVLFESGVWLITAKWGA